jgi:single-stranded DNA-binding protein
MNTCCHVRLKGIVDDIHQRWTPDGSLAVVASLMIHRPHLGPMRANVVDEQPMPLRAVGTMAEKLAAYQGKVVTVEGTLRRRYYSRDGEQRWGQVEIWVDVCHPEI